MPKRPSPVSASPSSAVSSVRTGRRGRSRRARPKSRTLTSPSAVTITFSGFKSPCTIPSAWAAAIPEAIWRVIDRSDSGRQPARLECLRQRFAGDVFHADDRHARRVVDGVDRAQVGMIERGRRTGLGQGGARASPEQSGLKTLSATDRSS